MFLPLEGTRHHHTRPQVKHVRKMKLKKRKRRTKANHFRGPNIHDLLLDEFPGFISRRYSNIDKPQRRALTPYKMASCVSVPTTRRNCPYPSGFCQLSSHWRCTKFLFFKCVCAGCESLDSRTNWKRPKSFWPHDRRVFKVQACSANGASTVFLWFSGDIKLSSSLLLLPYSGRLFEPSGLHESPIHRCWLC